MLNNFILYVLFNITFYLFIYLFFYKKHNFFLKDYNVLDKDPIICSFSIIITGEERHIMNSHFSKNINTEVVQKI